MRAFAKQPIGEVFILLIRQHDDGRAARAGIHFQEGIEQSRAIGQAEIEQDRVKPLPAQTVQRIGELFDMHDARGSPVAPLAVLFNLDQRLAQKLFVFEIVFYTRSFKVLDSATYSSSGDAEGFYQVSSGKSEAQTASWYSFSLRYRVVRPMPSRLAAIARSPLVYSSASRIACRSIWVRGTMGGRLVSSGAMS